MNTGAPNVRLALSGGLDSTAALAHILDGRGSPEGVHTYAMRYGQRHQARELEAARWVAAYYGTDHREVDLPALRSPALTLGGPVPHGHYADESMKATIVAGRNLLIIANLIALAEPGDLIVVGVHAGDHAIYPDCRPSFINPLRDAVWHGYGVGLFAPWLNDTKADIVAAGASLGAPLGRTWSCYEGGDVHCGQCGTCVERIEAFHDAGVTDSTVYAVPV